MRLPGANSSVLERGWIWWLGGVLLLIGGGELFLSAGSSWAHSAFYPHHLQDFGAIRSRAEVRITVLITTSVFVALLTTVIVLALKRGQWEAEEFQRSDRGRLCRGLEAAAKAASPFWPRQPSEALTAAIQAYAHEAHVPWDPGMLKHPESPVRCQLGTDQLVLSSRQIQGRPILDIQAKHADLRCHVLVDPEGRVELDAMSASQGPQAP